MAPGLAENAEKPPDRLKKDPESGIIQTWDDAYKEREIFQSSKFPNGLPINGKPNGIADRLMHLEKCCNSVYIVQMAVQFAIMIQVITELRKHILPARISMLWTTERKIRTARHSL